MNRLESSEIRAIGGTASRFAREVISRRTGPESNEGPGFPWEIVQASGGAGYLTGPLGEEFCGVGLDELSQVTILERLARAAAGPAAVIGFHASAVTALAAESSEPGVRSWLERLAARLEDPKPPLAALAIPEMVVDADRPATPIVEARGDEARITGEFLCFCAPEHAEKVVLVTSRGEDGMMAFLDASDLGALRREAYPGSGLEECPVARLRLEGQSVPAGAMLGARDCRPVMDRLRLLVSALEIGTASEAARAARAYAGERIQTGRPIIEHQEVARILSGMDVQIEAAWSLLFRAAAADEESRGVLAHRAHLFCGDAAESVCLDAVQTLGGYGYMKDYGIEKRLRDVKSLQAILGSYTEDWLI